MTRLYRKGDIVTVQSVVRYDQKLNEDTVFVEAGKGLNAFIMECSGVSLVTPHFDVGDRVSYDSRGKKTQSDPLGQRGMVLTGRVLAKHDRSLWVDVDDYGQQTWSAADCQYVEEDEVAS